MSDDGTIARLRQFTPARVGLGRAGGSLPTGELLSLRLAHARARDALLRPIDDGALMEALKAAGGTEVLELASAAETFDSYLLRPELGRTLDDASERLLKMKRGTFDLAVVVSEGLSTLAAETHAPAVVGALFPLLQEDGWSLAPVCYVRRGRVAVEDHVGECVGAEMALILLGERPGLASPDSLGAYLVRQPRRGNSDARRNCISNINRNGLTPGQAAAKLHWLLSEGRRRKISGVELKDESDDVLLKQPTHD